MTGRLGASMAEADVPLIVSVHDPETGETGRRELTGDDYCLITSGRMYLDSVVHHANGTRQLTLKLSKPDGE